MHRSGSRTARPAGAIFSPAGKMPKAASDIVQQAREHFKRDKSYWSEIYTKAKEDQLFLSDDQYAQWDQRDYQNRVNTDRPALTVDQLSQFIHQVANDIRMNTPTINVIPSGNGSDVETAEIFQGLIRNIEYRSNADDVYDTASLNAIRCSIGWIRVDHDYEDDEGFNQELLIKRVVNPLNCWIDSNSVECDGRDARHGTILEQIPVSEFKRLYPGYEVSCFENSDRNKFDDGETVTIAEHFVLEEAEREIALDAMGEVVEVKPGTPYERTRKVKRTRVLRFKLSGKDVLEETTFPGRYIPLVPVYGEEAWIDGKRHLFSLIRRSKDAQRMYNFWKSLETEILMKQPNAPIMAAEGQVEDYAEDWQNPSKSMVLRYRLKDAEGNPVPPPQRLEPPVMPTGILNASRGAVDDIKATMGLYNASIGQRSNETSGVAIAQRKVEGDVATFHFADNLVRSITHVGRILVCAIPEIYDTARIIRIVGLEEDTQEVGINGEMVEGQERPFDLSQGKYDVKVITGPSFTTKRQEAFAALSETIQRIPDLMQVMGDLYFKNADFAGAPAMEERMKKIMDPKLLDENADDPEKMQLQQQLQAAMAQLQALQQEMQSKQQEVEIKAQTEMAKIEAEREKTRIEAEIKVAELQLKQRELALKEAEAQAEIAALGLQNNGNVAQAM